MTESPSHVSEEAVISEQRMQFTIQNRRPRLTPEEKKETRAKLEQQLFAVFAHYV